MNKRGLLSVAVIVIFSLIAAFAFIYWKLSSQEIFTIFREGEKIIAVNLAKSGLNYAENLIYKSYYKDDWPIVLPSINHKKIKKEFDSGYFEIEYIKPLKNLKTKTGTFEKTYLNVPYYDKYGILKGLYDVYKIKVIGVSKKTHTKAELTTYLKTVRMEKEQK